MQRRDGGWACPVVCGLLLAGGGCGSDKPPPSVPIEQGPVTGFFLVGPSRDQEFTAFDATAAGGLVVVGHGGTSSSRDVFRWTASGSHAGDVTWIHPPAVEPDGLLGVLGFTVSSQGETISGSVVHQDSLVFYRWTEPEGVSRELTRALDGAPIEARAGLDRDGTTSFGSTASQSFRWTPSDGVQMLGAAPGDLGVRVTDISADGRVLAGNSLIDPRAAGEEDDVTRLFRWTSAGGVEPLPSPPEAVRCRTAGPMSEDGSVIFATCEDGASPRHTQLARWTSAGGTETLRVFPAFTALRVAAVSPDGGRAVVSAPPTMPTAPGTTTAAGQVLTWAVDGGWRALPLPDGTTACGPVETGRRWSSAGLLIGGCQKGSAEVAATWNAAGEPHLLLPTSDFDASHASSVSDDGELVAGRVGRAGSTGADDTRAVVWRHGQPEAVPVDALLRETFGLADLGGATLTTAEISQDGKTLAGQAIDVMGRKVAWIARLP